MPDIQKNPPENKPNPITKSTNGTDRSLGLILGAILVVILIVAFWLNARKKNSSLNSVADINKIRQVFQVPTSTPVQTPPQSAVEGTSTMGPSMPSSSSGGSSYPRGPGAATPAPTPQPPTYQPPAQPSQPPISPVYTNTGLGFSLVLQPNWVTRAIDQNTIGFFDNHSGREVGYIEVYGNTSNQSLGDLTVTLENSPDVTQISYTTLDNQPALEFLTTSKFKNGIATVYNNRIYYLRGDLTNPDISAGFKFQ